MENYRFDGTKKFSIKKFDCADKGEFSKRHEAIGEFVENLEKINEYQQKLFAEQKEGIIFIFQAMDAAGKDGAVRAVLSCLSPQGVSEHSFKVPTEEENRHDYLWRFWSAIPEKGSISIFNRSYYEDVLVQKIHKIYENNNYADRIDRRSMIRKRYEEICGFEQYLWDNSIRVVKIFLHVSKEEQARRFLSRIDTPKKNWKFSPKDVDERMYWDEYMDAYEKCINRTATKEAPWYVVPADHKWYARLVISRIVLNELKNMDPKWPKLSAEDKEMMASYREILAAECGELSEDEEKNGLEVKPSDTAIGIALKSDREALSEKKFRKLLKKSIFENFRDRFGVSDETQNQLGMIYLDIEEAEAKKEADALSALKTFYKEKKAALKAEWKGFGKEAKKLYKQYKKASRLQIKAFVENVNSQYTLFEEDVRKLMAEYETSVAAGGFTPEEALTEYEKKLEQVFTVHCAAFAESMEKAMGTLCDVTAEYQKIGKAFKDPAAEEAPSEEMHREETPVGEAPAEGKAVAEVPVKKKPAGKVPVKEKSVKKAAVKKTGAGEAAKKKTANKKAVLKKAEEKEPAAENPEGGQQDAAQPENNEA